MKLTGKSPLWGKDNTLQLDIGPQTVWIGSLTCSMLVVSIGAPPGLCAQPPPVHADRTPRHPENSTVKYADNDGRHCRLHSKQRLEFIQGGNEAVHRDQSTA